MLVKPSRPEKKVLLGFDLGKRSFSNAGLQKNLFLPNANDSGDHGEAKFVGFISAL